MQRSSFIITMALVALVNAPSSRATTLTILADFDRTNGTGPMAGLAADSSGNLFGTTSEGGTGGGGTVFEIPRTGGTYGTLTTLVNFDDTNGRNPNAGVIVDAAGNLYGTTTAGGTNEQGTVFEVPKTGTTYGTLATLANFNVTNGDLPYGGLVEDSAGNLFGTTFNGATAFEIPKTGSTYGTLTTIANLNGPAGSNSYAGLILDASGNLYGTAKFGGPPYDGTVFEIPKTGDTYGLPTAIAYFDATDGSYPLAGLAADAAGDLFGTTYSGGTGGQGTVFEVPKTGGTYGALTTLANFSGANGANPEAGLIVDAAGNLFGTTTFGGGNNDGTIFEIPKTGGSYGPLSTLFDFENAPANDPYGGLIADTAGNLYGTTGSGGTDAVGTVFEFTGTGFVTDAPEPMSLSLLAVGAAVLGVVRRGVRVRVAPGSDAPTSKPSAGTS